MFPAIMPWPMHTPEIEIRAKQFKGTILEGDSEDIAKECVIRHEANVVGIKKCGETVRHSTAILHFAMTLG